MHSISVSIDAAHADVKHWCDHDDGKVSLRLSAALNGPNLYLVGTGPELYNFANAIMETLVDRLGVELGKRSAVPTPGDVCRCENLNCHVCRGNGCNRTADPTIRCDYIGDICQWCASYMAPEYVHVRELVTS